MVSNTQRICISNAILRNYKITFFRAAIESTLLYGAETSIITKFLSTSLAGCDSKLLRYALNISLTDRVNNTQAHQELPRISNCLQIRRLIFLLDTSFDHRNQRHNRYLIFVFLTFRLFFPFLAK